MQAGKFDIIPTMTTIGSGIGIFGVVSLGGSSPYFVSLISALVTSRSGKELPQRPVNTGSRDPWPWAGGSQRPAGREEGGLGSPPDSCMSDPLLRGLGGGEPHFVQCTAPRSCFVMIIKDFGTTQRVRALHVPKGEAFNFC